MRVCSYDECFTDSDCAGTDAPYCACRDPRTYGANDCVIGNCAQDSDCGACGYCSPTPGGCNTHTGIDGYFCHTPQDACVNDSDCDGGQVCQRSVAMNYWFCGALNCAG